MWVVFATPFDDGHYAAEYPTIFTSDHGTWSSGGCQRGNAGPTESLRIATDLDSATDRPEDPVHHGCTLDTCVSEGSALDILLKPSMGAPLKHLLKQKLSVRALP